MQLSESSIYVGLKRLRDKLYQAQFLMDKANRIIYGTPLMEASLNSYFGICKNTNGYNQAMKILGCLSPKWFEFVRFNSQRVCLEALPEYKYNNRIIRKFNLYNDTVRKKRSTASAS